MEINNSWGKNPLTILIAKESLSCKGCKWHDVIWEKEICSHKDNNGRRPLRCRNYERGTNDKK